jgi:hypothetical protein
MAVSVKVAFPASRSAWEYPDVKRGKQSTHLESRRRRRTRGAQASPSCALLFVVPLLVLTFRFRGLITTMLYRSVHKPDRGELSCPKAYDT